MKTLMKENVIFDGRNLFDLAKISECGFHYESIGRKVVTPNPINGEQETPNL